MADPLFSSGGVSTGRPSGNFKRYYRLSGFGVMNENGYLEVPAIFKRIDTPDFDSGLAYAEIGYKGLIYKGYIETEGEKAGTFRFFVK